MSGCCRLARRGRWLWMALGAAAAVVLAGGVVSPALASASAVSWPGGVAPRVAGHTGTGLSSAPPGLRSAVRKVLGAGTGARGGGFEQARPGVSIIPPRYFGASVAVSGSTALVGVPGAYYGTGAAYVFVRSGHTWSQQAKLTASNGAIDDNFGNSVAVSGSTALIGAFGAAGAGEFTGAAYVFVRSGHTWSQQAELTPSDGATGDGFGNSVAVLGSTALIGAPYNNSNTGAAYVFVRSGHTWSQQAKLTASDAANDDTFGYSVAFSGSTALIGAPGRNSVTGAAYVFVRSGHTWSQQAELTASDAATDANFGASVAISGPTALIGAYQTNSATGAAYVFVRSGHTWSQQAELTASDAATGTWFGASVTVSGCTALVSAPYADPGPDGAGAVYVFVRSGHTWSQQARLTRVGKNGIFGVSVAFSASTALVGGPDACRNTGAVYVFVRSGHTWSRHARLPGSAHC